VGLTTLHRKYKCVTKNLTELRTSTDSLDKRPKRRNMDMRFGLRILERWDGVMWDWIGVAQDRNRWTALVNSVLNLRVP
jgi:hypothetical protein